MIHPIKSPGEVPQNPAAQKQNEEREKNEDHPQDDDMADVTPRNIDPSDENSAEPEIEAEPKDSCNGK